MYVRRQHLLVWLKIAYTTAGRIHRTAWRQPVGRVSRSVYPTVLCGCHAMYLFIIVSLPGCEDIRSGAAPATKTLPTCTFVVDWFNCCVVLVVLTQLQVSSDFTTCCYWRMSLLITRKLDRVGVDIIHIHYVSKTTQMLHTITSTHINRLW